MANDGYFSIKAFGFFTFPIPYDADPGLVKYAFESIYTVGNVNVEMEIDSVGLPSICLSTRLQRTTIQFLNYSTANIPPILLTRNTSKTREWPDGNQPLTLNSGVPTLHVATEHFLDCPICLSCNGYLYFTFLNSLSSSISLTADNAISNIKREILLLTDLINQNWTNLAINVTSSVGNPDVICSATQQITLTITLYSDYGNIPGLGILQTFKNSQNTNITFISNNGDGTLYECSNQGYCDRSSGLCQCLTDFQNGEKIYYTSNSDGHGNPGSIPDCGNIKLALSTCTVNDESICGHNGRCDGTTHKCVCYDGWSGINCQVKSCPKGLSFFDEPLASDTAHQLSECSNQGICDHKKGVCSCRKGFTGQACEIKDCIRNINTGEACNGRGWCYNIAKFYTLYGYSYGDITNNQTYPNNWDAFNWYECVCAAKTSSGFIGNPSQPLVAPK